jgi:hypothetical protein
VDGSVGLSSDAGKNPVKHLSERQKGWRQNDTSQPFHFIAAKQ